MNVESEADDENDATGHESVYSMDSFIEDLSPSNTADESGDERLVPPLEPPPPRQQNYLSPASSTSELDKSGSGSDHNRPSTRDNVTPQPSLLQLSAKPQETLHRRMSSDGILPKIQPEHPFFSPSFYEQDGDASDGSVVFTANLPENKGPPSTPQQQSKRKGHQRDRFPSFDSVGSSGSVHYVTPRSQLPAPQPTAASAVLPQILPYHERRKLMQQRQQQEEPTQPQPQQPPPYMMPPVPQPFFGDMAGAYAPVAHLQMPPPQMQPMPYAGQPMAPYPMHPPSLHMGSMYPPPPQQLGYPPMAQIQQAPTGRQPSSSQSNPRPAAFRGDSSSNRPPSASRTRPVPPSQPSVPRPPNRPAPPRSDHGLSLNRTRSSSLDSWDGLDAPPRQPHLKNDAPPPPPPPPPLPPGHVRHDSAGSVSSLGSLERSAREEESDDRNLFQRLNPWAKPKEAPAPSLPDFHRRNQEFLSKVDRQQQNYSPTVTVLKSSSPSQQSRRAPHGPPPSRVGSDKRLTSIDNDVWDDEVAARIPNLGDGATRISEQVRGAREEDESGNRSVSSKSSALSDYDAESSDVYHQDDSEPDERSKLLPPTGISSNEYFDKPYSEGSMRGFPVNYTSMRSPQQHFNDPMATHRFDNTTGAALLQYQREMETSGRRHKKKKKRSSRHRSRKRDSRPSGEISDASVSSSSASSQDHRYWINNRAKLLDQERAKLIKQWREEARQAEHVARRERQSNMWHRRLGRHLEAQYRSFLDLSFKFFVWLEMFIANLPLTIGAIALAVANLGVDWFKFAEENMESCEPVHFHSSQCTFPEFPGCFYCDTNAEMYKIALRFHWACSAIAGTLAFTFVVKLLLARRVVFDELSSPTTASPAGLICMAMSIVFAGRGFIGMLVVSAASFIHLCLAIWFIYMALAYHIMPDPSWFPNTVSIGLSAVKTWLYFPTAGHFLMAISLSLNFFFFPISLIRVALNKKISATVGWMQMSAPNISLYALTIMAQPSFKEEHPDVTDFQRIHRLVYLPCMHFLFALCIIGMLASVSSLVVRWDDFRRQPFSPAHAAFCCPTLSHANAVQAYRAAVYSFSSLPPHSPFRVGLYIYWVVVLVIGTLMTLAISSRFLWNLPKWTHINVEDEIEPPAPYETTMTRSNMITAGDTLVQSYVSPAVLQANETGALVLTFDSHGEQRYVRTRQVTALGFDPIMDVISLERERDLLLDWVGKNPPRRRHRTLSVPGIDFSYGADIGPGTGVYGMPTDVVHSRPPVRPRSSTLSPQYLSSRRHFEP